MSLLSRHSSASPGSGSRRPSLARGLARRFTTPFLVVCASCTCESETKPPSEPAPARIRCVEETESHFVVRASGEPAPSGDDGAALFAVEIGRVAPREQELLIPYTDHDGRASQARLLGVPLALGAGQAIALGALHGDAAPPQVAVSSDRAFVVVADRDAGGQSYRVGRLSLPLSSKAEVDWLSELAGGQDRSPAFDVAALGDAALVVWDDWDSSEGHGFVQGAWLGPDTREPRPLRLSLARQDVEGPRVVARDGGFWLSWVALGALEPAADVEDEDTDVVRVGRRWIQLLRLDASGNPDGSVLDITPKDGYAVGFDVLAGHGGSVLIAFREGKSTPGIGGGSIRTASVSPSGSVQHNVVVEEGVGTGLPSLVFDPDPKNGAPHLWLSYSSSEGDTQLVALSPRGVPVDSPLEAGDLGESALVGARSARLVLGRPRARNFELYALECRAERPEPPPAGESAGHK